MTNPELGNDSSAGARQNTTNGHHENGKANGWEGSSSEWETRVYLNEVLPDLANGRQWI